MTVDGAYDVGYKRGTKAGAEAILNSLQLLLNTTDNIPANELKSKIEEFVLEWMP